MNHEALSEFDYSQPNIDELKKQYGDIYKVGVADTDFIIRPLYKDDWDTVVRLVNDNPNLSQADFDDKVVDCGLIGPRPDFGKGGWSVLPAGIPSTLSMYIRGKSGFVVPELPDAMSVQIDSVAKAAPRPDPTPEEIEKLKKECPLDLWSLKLDSFTFMVRPITRQEWRAAVTKSQESNDQELRNLLVADRAVIWPKKIDWNKEPAGLCETITEFVLSISGYTAQPDVEKL